MPKGHISGHHVGAIGVGDLIRGAVGALSGAVGGIGASIVLVQGGHVGVEWAATISWPPIILGAAIGFVEPPPRLKRALVVVVTVAAAFVFVRGASPAAATDDAACSLHAEIDGATVDLTATSRSQPFTIDVDKAQDIAIRVEAPAVRDGVVEVVVASVAPMGSLFDVGDRVVYFDRVEGGAAIGEIEVVPESRGRYRIVGERWASTAPALGVLELDAHVTSITDDGPAVVCRATLWVRAVAAPLGNALGRVGLAMSTLGAAGLLWVSLRAAGWSPAARRAKGASPGPRDPVEPVSTHAPSSGPEPMPAPLLTDVELLGADDQPVRPTEALVVGRDYRLLLTLSPGLETSDRAAGDGLVEEGEVDVRASGARVTLLPSWSLFGAPVGFDIRPLRSGPLSLVVEYHHRDRVVTIGRVERNVAAPHELGTLPMEWSPPASDVPVVAEPPTDELMADELIADELFGGRT